MLVCKQSLFKSRYLLKEHDPGVKEKSSIAMPPDPPFPAKASNVTCQRNNMKAAIKPKSLCCIILRATLTGVIKHLRNQVKPTKTYEKSTEEKEIDIFDKVFTLCVPTSDPVKDDVFILAFSHLFPM